MVIIGGDASKEKDPTVKGVTFQDVPIVHPSSPPPSETDSHESSVLLTSENKKPSSVPEISSENKKPLAVPEISSENKKPSSIPETSPDKPDTSAEPSTNKTTSENPDLVKVLIREWICVLGNMTPMMVPAVTLSWPVPTVNRLWFGCSKDDSKRRIRAFLSCLRSDSPLMLQPSYVPQRILMLATVLRYLVSSSGGSVLTRQELDAFIVTAFSDSLGHVPFLQDLQVSL